MTILGKEQERQLTPEEIATAEVDGYIEKVEKHAEMASDVSQVVQQVQPPTLTTPVKDDKGQVVLEEAISEPPIELPLTEREISEGLHHKIADAILWAATFCVYLIKKYPGRVFYKSEQG